MTNRGAGDWAATELTARCRPDSCVLPLGALLTGSTAIFDGARTRLPARVVPGETIMVTVEILPPPEPGRYVLVLDLVREGVRWFGIDERIELDVDRSPTTTWLPIHASGWSPCTSRSVFVNGYIASMACRPRWLFPTTTRRVIFAR